LRIDASPRWWLRVAQIPACTLLLFGFPARLQAVAIQPQRVVSRQLGHCAMWRTSHTLGGWTRWCSR
jgi:hypothetical protein